MRKSINVVVPTVAAPQLGSTMKLNSVNSSAYPLTRYSRVTFGEFVNI